MMDFFTWSNKYKTIFVLLTFDVKNAPTSLLGICCENTLYLMIYMKNTNISNCALSNFTLPANLMFSLFKA